MLRPAVLALLVLVPLAGCAVNPVTGESELSFVSAGEELQLGDNLHPAVIYDYDGEYLDPELKRYLGTIVLRLHKVSHRADMPVDFKVLNSSIFNAFAIPGHVYVTRGALARMTNEAEFAAVMGHEMSHYTARHSAKQLTNQQLTGIGLGIAGMFLPEDGSTSGQLLLGAGAVGVKLAQLHYGRSQEEQADRVGTYYLYRAGYEPTRMLDMQRLLHSIAGGGQTSFLAEYFSTHPSEATRLRRIEAVIQEQKLDDGKLRQGDGTFAARWQRRLAPLRAAQKAYDVFDRAQALATKEQYAAALQLCRQAQGLARNQAPFHRLEGDLLRATKRPREALAAYRQAIGVDRRYLPAVRGVAAANFALGDFSAAASDFRAALGLLPGDLDSHFGLGLSTFRQEKYDEAVRSFETVVESVAYPPALSYLGSAYEKLDRRDRAIVAYRACLEAGTGDWKDSEVVKHARQRLDQLGAAPAPR